LGYDVERAVGIYSRLLGLNDWLITRRQSDVEWRGRKVRSGGIAAVANLGTLEWPVELLSSGPNMPTSTPSRRVACVLSSSPIACSRDSETGHGSGAGLIEQLHQPRRT
jgi:hypothetical protein